MGSSAYRVACDAVNFGPGECIVEIGSERGEGSTAYLARVAADAGVPFFSVDPDPTAAERVVGLEVEFLQARGEDALADWDGRPAPRLAWLDGHDWPYSWHLPGGGHYKAVGELRELYRRWGTELTREQSQASHLTIAEHLHRPMPAGSVIGFDDTWFTGEEWTGKGGSAVPFLLGEGWETLHRTLATEPTDGCVIVQRAG